MEYLTFVINTCNNDNLKKLQSNVSFFVVANGGTEPLANFFLKSLKREILRLSTLTSSYHNITCICKIRFDVACNIHKFLKDFKEKK